MVLPSASRSFRLTLDEASGIAVQIADQGDASWGHTAVLARTRAILQPVLEALRANGVKAAIATRRDRFISPQFYWLQACLDQALRPADRQVFTTMVDAANRIAGMDSDAALLAAEAEQRVVATWNNGRSPCKIALNRTLPALRNSGFGWCSLGERGGPS